MRPHSRKLFYNKSQDATLRVLPPTRVGWWRAAQRTLVYVACRVAARHPAGREGSVRERAGHGDGHGGGHAEPLAFALQSGLRVVLLVDAEAIHDRARELHIATGPDAVRVHDAGALVCGHRLVVGAGVFSLRACVTHTHTHTHTHTQRERERERERGAPADQSEAAQPAAGALRLAGVIAPRLYSSARCSTAFAAPLPSSPKIQPEAGTG
jgi:hypothetical protein